MPDMNFCYRLTVRNGKFTSIHGVDSKTDLLTVCPVEVVNESLFKKNGWNVFLNKDRNTPGWKIEVEHRTDEKEDYSYYCRFVDSGDLFLFTTSSGQFQALFYYQDIQSTMLRLFGITAIYYSNDGANGRYETRWYPTIDDEKFRLLTWYHTDGNIQTSFKSDESVSIKIGSYRDHVLDGRSGCVIAEISNATWTVAASIEQERLDGSKTLSATLYVNDEAAAISAIPKLHAYLEDHCYQNFYELLFDRLP